MVARMARHRPDAVALTGDAAMTYAELDDTADAWAAQLVAAGARPGDCVPVLLRRTTRLVVALLAVLKTGAAYALLDRQWPAGRLREVLEQLDAPVLATDLPTTPPLGLPEWYPPDRPPRVPAGFRPVAAGGADPCCVFFTSGTTGRPKGVLTTHRATARLFRPGSFVDFHAGTVMPLAAPMPWDAFSLELWSVLLSGGTSVIVDEPYLSAGSLRTGVSRYGVSTVWLTSSLFNMLVDEDLDAFTGVREVMTGGERLSPGHVGRFLRRHPTVALLNGYGPVESTVFATTHRITPADCERPGGIPLGRPVPGTQVFVLDGTRPCPVGEVGEICIAGDGLALRYLDDPELTRARFPCLALHGEPRRVYRSGDLGLWDRDGLLHFRGRADRQVKVHGHRIEPAEIERRIEDLLPVRACRVLVRRDGSGSADGLVAFCVPSRAGDRLDDAIGVLRSALVPHQRPAAVVPVDGFPLTAQGKLNEWALLAMQPPSGPHRVDTADAGYDDPTTRAVAETFRAVLGRGVPAEASFFEIGGTSLQAGRVCARLATRLDRPVPVSWLYQDPTVTALAHRLRSQVHVADSTTAAGNGDEAPLTPMQMVYLTRHLVDPSSRVGYCMLVWSIRGPLDRGALESAIAAVHRRQPALRAAYLPDPRPTVRAVDIAAPALDVLGEQPDLDSATGVLRACLARPLDPLDARVWRTALVPVRPGPAGPEPIALFGCVVHHIAFDGWSESVLARDLAAAYDAACGVGADAPPGAPPSLAAGYTAYAGRCAGADLAGQRESLRAELSGVPELHWPAGYTRPARDGPGHWTASLDTDVVAAVDTLAAEAGVTRFVALLSAWARSVAHVTGQRDFAIGVPVAQRGAGCEDAVGCHITVLAIRLRGTALDGGAAAVRETGRIVKQAFAAQDVPFADVLDLVNPARAGRPPVFQTLLALQDNRPARLNLTGLHTELRRQPYLDLPVELHAEFWPRDDGGLRLVVSFQADVVPQGVAHQCAGHLTDELRALRR